MRLHDVGGEVIVPRLALAFKHLSYVSPLQWRCAECDMPLAAVTEDALVAAFESHVVYVNTLDKSHDVHFEMQRLDALLAD